MDDGEHKIRLCDGFAVAVQDKQTSARPVIIIDSAQPAVLGGGLVFGPRGELCEFVAPQCFGRFRRVGTRHIVGITHEVKSGFDFGERCIKCAI
jgi:hypothetical protein